MYMRNRYYDPATGRFTQQDPIGLAGGLNLYGFANGDPVNLSDPFGLAPDCRGLFKCLILAFQFFTEMRSGPDDVVEGKGAAPEMGRYEVRTIAEHSSDDVIDELDRGSRRATRLHRSRSPASTGSIKQVRKPFVRQLMRGATGRIIPMVSAFLFLTPTNANASSACRVEGGFGCPDQ
jgi:uncharacterized protein RhaS with RHS repeats